jgi:hypothetical protein
MLSYIKWFELAAALAAIANWKKIKQDPLVAGLAFVAIFVAIAEFFGAGLKAYFFFNALYYNLFVNPVTFICYGWAFYRGFTTTKYKKFAIAGLVIVLVLFFSTITIFNPKRYLNTIGYNFGAIYIAAMAMFKLTEIIQTSINPNYFKSPVTFCLLFIMIYYLVTIPSFSVVSYYFFNQIKNDLTLFLNYISAVFNYVLYTSFILTFLLWGNRKV